MVNWIAVSSLVFWRYPITMQTDAKIGFPIHFLKNNLAKSKKGSLRNTHPKFPFLCQMFIEKMQRITDVRHIKPGDLIGALDYLVSRRESLT